MLVQEMQSPKSGEEQEMQSLKSGEDHDRTKFYGKYRQGDGKKLTSVGIDSAEKLIQTGAKQAFIKLKSAYPQVCLVHLYALEGAIENVEFNALSEDKKRELKELSDFLKR